MQLFCGKDIRKNFYGKYGRLLTGKIKRMNGFEGGLAWLTLHSKLF